MRSVRRGSDWLALFLYLGLLVGGRSPIEAQQKPLAVLISFSPTTDVRRSADGPFVSPVRRKLPLGAGYVLQTDARGRAEALFRDGRDIKLDLDTVLEFSATRADLMRVIRGNVRVRVPPPSDLEIDGPGANAHVHGTDLHFSVGRDGTTTLTVIEGEVEFANDRGRVVVRNQQQSTARPGQAPTPPVAAANLPFIIQWSNEIQPISLLLEITYISQDPARLKAARREAEALPPGPERARRLGDVLHDQGQLVEAQQQYQAALAETRRRVDARRRRRELVEVQYPYQAALAETRRREEAGTRRREEVELEGRLGQTWLELGNVVEAEAAFRRSLDLDSTPARVGLVLTLLSRRQDPEALSEARTAVERDGRSALAYTALALAQIRLGRREEAQQALSQARALDPSFAQAYAWHSFLLRAGERVEEAHQAAQRAVELAPHSSLARQAFSDTQFALGRTREARREAERAVALNSLSPGAHVSLGRALLQEGNVEAAGREAGQAVALGPDLSRARFFYGVVLAQQRRYERAAAELRQALEQDPGYLEARAFLARVYLAQGRRGDAVAVVREAIERDPSFAPAHAALGQVYWRSGRLKEAAAEYRQALEQAPGSLLYHVGLARVYLDQNNLPDALAQGQAAVSVAPSSSEAHAVLGLVYDRQDNPEQAIREYREAVSLSPENSLARLGLAIAFPPRSRELAGSGRERARERAQGLLRDPAVLQDLFEPGVTSEVLVGGGGESREEQRYLHRGQFGQGRVHDLTVASRFSDDGDRKNSSARGRLLQTDVAAQATPQTQVLFEFAGEKNSGGLPESEQRPSLRASYSFRQNQYSLYARQSLWAGTHLWLGYGIRAMRRSRDDPDAPPRPVPGLCDLSLYHVYQRANERVAELRLDHRVGRHHFTYGLADLRLNQRLPDLKYRLPADADPECGNASVTPALQDQSDNFLKDSLQYLQDEYRPGGGGSLIVGAQRLRIGEQNIRRRRIPLFADPGSPLPVEELVNKRRNARELLPYLVFTYPLDARNLVRVLGNKSLLRPSSPLLAPSEAFIVGEPISIYFTAGEQSEERNSRAETYELDYERRFSPRTFVKTFWESSLARDFNIVPTQEQQVIPLQVLIPRVRVQIAGLRLEHQLNRFLSGFARWSYWTVEDRTATSRVGRSPVVPNPARGLQVPFEPRWRGLMGLNYVDRTGLKASLLAHFLGRRFTDVTTFGSADFNRRGRRPSIGPHLLIDLRLGWEPSVRTEYGLTVTNLFNTSYQDVLPGFRTRGRTWVLTFARRF